MRDPKGLRSHSWFNGPEYYNFARRAWLRAEGFSHSIFEDKPIIGICNSWSELNNCNVHLRSLAEAVKRGVWAAGGAPLEFTTISLGEMFMEPTTPTQLKGTPFGAPFYWIGEIERNEATRWLRLSSPDSLRFRR